MVAQEILIWNKEIGFLRIAEGTGDNLLDEDEAEGYDYMMVDHYEGFENGELIEFDGGQVMLTEMYQDMFNDTKEVIQYLIDDLWIPNAEYIILVENN